MNTYAAERAEAAVTLPIERALVDLTTIVAPRLTPLLPSAAELSDPPPGVVSMVDRISKKEEEVAKQYALEHDSRRRHQRVAYPCTIVVVPVTRSLAPHGEPFKALIQDISESGLRLLHTRVIETDYMIVSWRATELPLASICLLTKVVRSEPRGLFYSVAGQFVLDD